jgi:hypothetical protein
MNFVSRRKSYLVSLVLGILCMQFVMVGAEKGQFREDERVYAYQLTDEIEAMFEVVKVHVAKFIDATDHTPYKKLVVSMCEKLDEFEKQVIVILTKKLAEAKIQKSEAFHESLSIVHEVLTEFIAKINVLKNILLKPEYLNTKPNQVSKNGLQLSKELEKYFHELMKENLIEQLEAKIDKVQGLVAAAGDKELSEKLKTIKVLLTKALKSSSLQKKSGSKSPVAALNGVSAKMRHNNEYM